MTAIIGNALPNLPWEEKPAGCKLPMWRYSKNPITGWDPTESTARMFNSAVLPYKDGFVGVFRADHKSIIDYYKNIKKPGLEYHELDYGKCLDFLLMTVNRVETEE